jgi:hypothetical protein
MRSIALLVAFVALAGCKSGGERPDRDYTSVNKRSVDFLFDTFREGNRVRKKSLKQDLAFSKRAPQNRMIRKTSVAFAWQSFWAEEWSGFSQIKQGLKAESVPVSERLAQMRFGFLDSGS